MVGALQRNNVVHSEWTRNESDGEGRKVMNVERASERASEIQKRASKGTKRREGPGSERE